ncbi:peroxiredoxin-like family protein [Mucilaginibacter sabulilitoris]|uniref:thioredoxin-dependent peroxiredoxin n=1 Tax=Mucilaginibacter sabulilitoris TaxID=1173583 RepID=A0ABZ0TUF5_9SPHI|nr:peroxiredoxin-like family protein [Mucilaginibacter sabulilitoris]WPU94765.1 peroxiredoxin-like family protein [Mucilaginibacter sabulilitoris]
MKFPIAKIFTFITLTAVLATGSLKANAEINQPFSRDTSKAMSYPDKSTDISPLLIGESIPAVKIPASDGQLYDLNASITQKPTILVFYRGGWCPFCNKELAGIQTIQADLVKMGYQIIAISTDSPENLSKSIDKNQLTYKLLSDADLAVSKQFGLAFKAPAAYGKTLEAGSNGKNIDKLLPVPSVFILDKKGVILFEYINPDFRQRISPELMLSVAASLSKVNK